MFQFRYISTSLLLVASLIIARPVDAQPETFFPQSTKGFLTVNSVAALKEALKKTSMGEMKKDPDVKKLLDGITDAVVERLRKKWQVSLGLDLKDLEGVVTGSLSIGLIQPSDDILGFISIAEFSDEEKADNLLAKVRKKLLSIDGVKQQREIIDGKTRVYHYQFKDPPGIIGPPQVFYGRTEKYLISYYGPVLPKSSKESHFDEVTKFLKSLRDGNGPSLATRENYKQVMKRVLADDRLDGHQIRWYADAFGFIDAAARIWPEQFDKEQYGTFRKVGFDAVKAFGGAAKVQGGDPEWLVRGFIYAPPVTEKDRFLSSAKMLDFTADAAKHDQVPSWIGGTASSYFSMHMQMLKMLDASKDLIDSVYNKGTYRTFLDTPKFEPKLRENFDIREDFVKNLGNRVVAIRDTKIPADANNDRVVYAIKIGDNEDVVAKTLWKYMRNEIPDSVKKKTIKVGPDNQELEIHISLIYEEGVEGPDDLKLDDLDGLDGLDLDLDPSSGGKKPRSGDKVTELGFCVYKNYFFVCRDMAFLEETLKKAGNETKSELVTQSWFKKVNAQLDSLKGDGFESFRFVFQLDRPYKAVFELLKKSEGELPIETTIKEWLDEKGDERLIDMSLLPKDFDKSIAPYLNPGGWLMTTEPDGWLIYGVSVKKP